MSYCTYIVLSPLLVTKTTITALRTNAVYLHLVEVDRNPVREALTEDDFAYMDPKLDDDGRTRLMNLVKKYRDCLAKCGCCYVWILDV